MILVYHHGCVKYTLYMCNLKILSYVQFYVRDNNKCLLYALDTFDRSNLFAKNNRSL